MPILGIFDEKPNISGRRNSSPTARRWAEIKEKGCTAGRWITTRNLFSQPREMNGGGGQGQGGWGPGGRGLAEKAPFQLSMGRVCFPCFQPC